MFKLFKFGFFFITFFLMQLSAAPDVIAHRGGGHNYPENTLLAFSRAMEMGCTGIELDLQVTKDDVVVVYHPNDLSVHTNGSGTISSKKWEEIALLDSGYRFKPESNYPFRKKGLTIPRFSEVLKLLPQQLIIVDLKSSDYKKLLVALEEMLNEEEVERLVFYSTNREPIEWIKEFKPHWKTFETRDKTRLRLLKFNQKNETSLPLSSSWVGFELKKTMQVKETFTLGEGVSSVEFKFWNPEIVFKLKDKDPFLKLVLFGINTREDLEEACLLDVDLILTDDPQKILEFLANLSDKFF